MPYNIGLVHTYVKGIIPFTILYYAPPSSLEPARITDRVVNSLSKASGVFSLLGPILMTSKSGSVSDLDTLIACTGRNLTALSYLPEQWKSYLPSEVLDASSMPRSAWPPQFTRLTWTNEPGHVEEYSWVGIGSDSNTTDAVELIRALPAMATYFAVDADVVKVVTPEDRERVAEAILQLCRLKPQALMYYPEVWGKLLSMFPSASEELRKTMQNALDYPIQKSGYIREFNPFQIQLPQEMTLLPVVLNLSLSSVRAEWAMSVEEEGSPKDRVAQFLSDAEHLLTIAEDDTIPAEVAGAAGNAVSASSEGGPRPAPSRRAPSHKEVPPDNRLLVHARRGGRVPESAGDEEVRGLLNVGKLLQAGRSDFSGRSALDPVLERWRQTSRAPVHRAGQRSF